jgi:hypothetical protein
MPGSSSISWERAEISALKFVLSYINGHELEKEIERDEYDTRM